MEQEQERSESDQQPKETDRLIASTEEKPTYNTTDASGDGMSPPKPNNSSAPSSPQQQGDKQQEGQEQQGDQQDGSASPTAAAAADTSHHSNQSDPDAITVLNTSNRSGGSGSGQGGSPASKEGRTPMTARDDPQRCDLVIAAMVLSVIACIVFVIVGIPALIFACRAQTERKYGAPQLSRRHAKISVILACVGTSLGAAMWILLTWYVFLKL